jgi:hypothetical protein
MEELRNECEQQGEETTGAIRNLAEVAQAGAEEHVPGASETRAQAAMSCESSHESCRDRLESITESLRQEGFEGLSAELGTAREEDIEASSSLAGTFDELGSEQTAAQEVISSAESEATGGFEEAISALESEALPELESVTSGKMAELQSAGATGHQDVEQIKSQMKEVYGGWSGDAEGSRDDLMEKVISAVEETMQHLTEAQQAHLHEPCEQLLREAVPKAQAGLEGVVSEGAKWGGGSEDLSRTAGEMEQAKDAKDSFDRTVG